MNKEKLNAKLAEFQSKEWLDALHGIKRGYEKEALRVDFNGMIAETPHLKALGSPLTHPMITTDFSEALLEFITPPTENIELLLNTLMELHHYTYQIVEDEYLLTASMPLHFPKKDEDIPIAQYGTSNYGQMKHIYRKGLSLRYGRKMQTIAGTHYNFSLPNEFWDRYRSLLKREEPLKDFISEQYLGMIRNCFRYGWILPFLFGASPAFDADFLGKKKVDISHLNKVGDHTWVGSFATSLRLSDLGYSSEEQAKANISYNSLLEYIETMRHAIHTVYPEYAKFGVKKGNEYLQLSDCILQVEDEHYSLFRPKRVAPKDERMLSAIEKEGIEYVEVRALDTNPFEPIGITNETVYLLDCFLLACLFTESMPLSELDNARIKSNFTKIIKWGRKPALTLTNDFGEEVDMLTWAKDIMFSMDSVAKLLDTVYGGEAYSEAIWKQNTLPSARILAEMYEKNESYVDFALRWSNTHQVYFKTKPMLPESFVYYRYLAEESFKAQKNMESSDKITLEEYINQYLKS